MDPGQGAISGVGFLAYNSTESPWYHVARQSKELVYVSLLPCLYVLFCF